MPRSTTHVIFSLLLVSLCSCGDNVWRKLPEERDIVFEGTTKAPQQSVYRPGQARDIQLDLTSSDAEAKEAKFKVVSWSEANGKQGTLDTSSVSLGSNTFHYTPQEPGTHKITLKVAVEGEEASAQTFNYTVEVPAAEWQVRGRANSTGQITLTIEDAPEAWHSEPWRITSTTFSEGLQGRIEPMPTRLNHGDNNLNIILDQVVLQEEEPHIRFTTQGPDGSSRDHQVDLTAFCVARLRDEMGERDRSLADGLREVNDQHEPETERLYPLESETVTDPRVNREKNNEITERLNLMERDLEAYDRDLQRLEALEVQDPEHPNRQLPTFRRGKQRLQDAIASLKSAQVQLQQQCTTAHEALFKTLQNDEQEATNILLDDPRLDVNAWDGEGQRRDFSLLMRSAIKGNATAAQKLIDKGSDLTDESIMHQDALYYAVQDNQTEVVEVILNHGINVNKKYGPGNGDTTVLHLAVFYGHHEIIELLLEQENIEINTTKPSGVADCEKYPNGKTALDIARERGHTEIVALLTRAGTR